MHVYYSSVFVIYCVDEKGFMSNQLEDDANLRSCGNLYYWTTAGKSLSS